jgi:MFS family permease
MQKALDLRGAAAGSLASWNLVGYTLMAFAGGLLASRFGARKVVTIGLVVTTAGMVLTGFAGGLATASAGRFLTGLGGGMVMGPSVALMASWFDTRRLGLASTVATSGNGLALLVAGPVVPSIVAGGGDGGWRQAWFFFAAVTSVVAVLTLALERDRPYGAPQATTPRSQEKGTARADLRRVVRSGYAWHLGSVNFLYGFAFLAYFTFFQKRLTADLGFSGAAAGYLFLIVGVAGLACGVLWGTFPDRVGRGRAISALLAVQAIAALLFGLRLGTAALVISAVVFGTGVFSVPALIGAACGDGFGPKLAFVSLGFVTIFVGCGMAIGPYVGGLLEDRFSSLGPSYLVSAGVFVVGAVAALLLPDTRRPASARTSPDPC